MLGITEKKDRYLREKENAIDVLMLTLDAETFLERCIDSIYQEIPVNRLIICDGGSRDSTKEILMSYPRVVFHVRPDIKTTGKGYEFLFSQLETEWFALMDADVEVPNNWYDEMKKYQNKYDFYECKRVMAYHFYRDVERTVDPERRSYSGCQIGKRDAFKDYHCDDDYVWRTADLFAHQHVVKSGFKYGKVSSTFHYHHTGEGERYKSDEEKAGTGYVFQEPEHVFLKNDAWKEMMKKHAKAVVKYLDPDFLDYKENAIWLELLDKSYIEEHNPAWLKYYKKRPGKMRKLFLAIPFLLIYTLRYIKMWPKRFAEDYKKHLETEYNDSFLKLIKERS